jgi:hypothetical protein
MIQRRSMRIQIEPTEIETKVGETAVRVWNGITPKGTQVFVFVARLAVRNEDQDVFDEELAEDPGRAVLRELKAL